MHTTTRAWATRQAGKAHNEHHTLLVSNRCSVGRQAEAYLGRDIISVLCFVHQYCVLLVVRRSVASLIVVNCCPQQNTQAPLCLICCFIRQLQNI
jgi:hypothetical protein